MTDTGGTISKLRTPPQSFMARAEFRKLRKAVICGSLTKVSQEFVNPSTGRPISFTTLYRWESGKLPIPWWAAKRILQLAELARKLDLKEAKLDSRMAQMVEELK